MTAICKTKLIHGTNLQPLLDYGSNQEKTSFIDNALQDALDYAANPLKTIAEMEDGDKELLVSGVLCEPQTALLDFSMVRERYLEIHGPERIYRYEYLDKRTGETRMARRDPVTAIHLIQSFSERGLDPRTVHQIGIDLCERLGVMAVVDTHMNTDHLHNHIIINAYMPDGGRKFVMEKASILRIRELSDQLQQEYGINLTFEGPWRQLQISKGHDTYGEWKAKRQSISWKEEMKDEIAAAKSVSDNREEFIAIMQDYGYEIARQEADSITWWNKAHTRKIRDRTLGDAYELGILFPDGATAPEYTVKTDFSPEKKRPRTLSVARYDWNGRRRSDLELLIRKAIALIQHAGNRYHTPSASYTRSASYKVQIMEQALEAVQKLGLEDRDALKSQLNQVGARLSYVKASLRKLEGQKQFYDIVSPLLSSLQATRHTVDSIRYWPDGKMPDLMLKNFSAAESGKARAQLCPMSATQRRELYLKLKAHPEVTLAGKGFSEVSAMDAEEIFAYFKGNRPERPYCLKDSTELTMERIYQKRNDHLRSTFTKPIQKYQRKRLAELLSTHGLSADMDTLTQFDAINIENCLGANPFSEQPIDAEKQRTLTRRLRDASLSTSRETKYILPGEYETILDYLDGVKRAKPAILKPSPQIDAMTAEKLQSFMDAKHISCSIPVSAMCRSDYDRMYGYVISQGRTPDCATPAPKDRTTAFHETIAADGITEKKRLLLLKLRNQMNELLELDIDPHNTETLEKEISDFRRTYDTLEAQRTELGQEYSALLRLSQQLSYAESPPFLFGPLFNERVHKVTEVTEKEEPDQKPEKENRPDISHRSNSLFDIDRD